jgi:putative sporulation protein YtaF
MAWLSTLVLSLAVSLDSLGVGFAYGVKKLRVPAGSLILMSVVSALGMLSSMLVGRSLCFVLGNKCQVIGSVILILMGLFSFRMAWRSHHKTPNTDPGSVSPATPLKMVTRVVEEPVEADLDASGEISITEAVLLGVVLALDSLGAGLGAALAAYRLTITSGLVGLLTLVTLIIGHRIGQMVELPSHSWASFIPGLLLVLLGSWQLL